MDACYEVISKKYINNTFMGWDSEGLFSTKEKAENHILKLTHFDNHRYEIKYEIIYRRID